MNGINTSQRKSSVHPAVLIGGICLAVTLAYSNSFTSTWVFDDLVYVHPNRDLLRLWPPVYLFGNSRPVLYFTFALNYALSGWNIWSYHLLNVLIHLGCVLLLFDIVRQSLSRPWFTDRTNRSAPVWIASATALLWGVHPLTTMAVTYIWQRGESLMAFFYLATLVAFIRGTREGGGRMWLIVSALACILGAGSKEIIVSAPLVVLLYDRAFNESEIRLVLRRRWWLYLTYAGAVALVFVMLAAWQGRFHTHGGIGYGDAASSPLEYILTVPGVILLYLRLAMWPDPLVFDYGWPLVRSVSAALPALLPVLLLLGLTLWGVVRNRRWAVPAAAFFLILAPTTSIMPMPDPVFEYRMYLPLAALLAGCAGGGAWALPVLWRRKNLLVLTCAVMVASSIALGVATYRRNQVYNSREALWLDTVGKRPANPRAHVNVGERMVKRGEEAGEAGLIQAGLAEFDAAIALDPAHASAHYNKGVALLLLGRLDEAEASLTWALASEYPRDRTLYALGSLYFFRGDVGAARYYYRRALRENPRNPDARRALETIRGSGGEDGSVDENRE